MNRLVFAVGLAVGIGLAAKGLSAQTEEWRRPACELDMGHFLVKNATTYMQAATEEVDPGKREQLMTDAYRNLAEAISTDQAENPSVWYFLGRYYVMANDGVGADSAFAHVEQTVPECQEDITYYRQSTWVKAVNRGIDSLREGAYEGAKWEFRNAAGAWDGSNVPFFYMASVFGDEGEMDSALYYFKKVTDIGIADTSHLDNYETAVENVAVLYQMLEEWDSTVVWYRKVRELDPGNTDALFGIAEAYTFMGDNENAIMIYDSVLANPAAMSDLDLFNAGVKLFNVDDFDRAVRAFEAGLAKNPNHRDALYNVANTYLAIANDQSRPQADRDEALRNMDRVTHKLLEIDPQNRLVYRILAAAHTMQGMDDSTAVVMDAIDALDFEVTVDLSRPESGSYLLAGRVLNLRDSGITFPTVTFEFLNGAGTVIATASVPGEALEADGVKRFSFNQPEEGIAAWRYRIGS